MATIGALIWKLGLDISTLTENVNQVNARLDSMEGFAKRAGAAMAGMISVGAITSAVSKYTEFTGRITDLAAATGISVQGVQSLDYAAKQTGSSFEAVAKAVGKMSSGLTDGDKSTVGALSTLGLSLGSLRAMSPDQAFSTIADAIATIPDPMRQSALALDLFGKGGRELLPMIKSGVGDLASEARQLGLVLSDDAVAAGDKFGDTLDQLKTAGMGLLSSVLTPMMPALTSLVSTITANLQPAFVAMVDGVRLVSGAWTGLARPLRDLIVVMGAAASAVWVLNSALMATAATAAVALASSLASLVTPLIAVAGLIAGGSGVVASISLLLTPVGWMTVAAAALAGALWLLRDPLVTVATWLADTVWTGFQQSLSWIVAALAPIYDWFMVWGPAIGVVVGWIGSAVWSVFTSVLANIGSALAMVWDGLLITATHASAAVGWIGHAAWEGFKAVVGVIATSIIGIVDALKTFVEWIRQAAAWVSDKAWELFPKTMQALSDAISYVIELLDLFKNSVAEAVTVGELPSVESAWRRLGDRGLKPLQMSAEQVAAVIQHLNAGLKVNSHTAEDAAEAARRHAEALAEATRRAVAFAKAVDDATGMTAYRQAVEALRIIDAAGDRIDPGKFEELAKTVSAGADAARRLGLHMTDGMRAVDLLGRAGQAASNELIAGFSGVGTQLDWLIAKSGQWQGLLKSMPLKNLPAFMELPKGNASGELGLNQLRPSAFSGLGQGFLGQGGVIASQAGNMLDQKWAPVFDASAGQLGTNFVKKWGGAITGSLGPLLGGLVNTLIPVIGSLASKIVGMFDKSGKNAANAANAYGVKLSESLSAGIVSDSKSIFNGNFQAATIFNLSKMIDEAGGVTQSTVRKWSSAAGDIFSMVQTGKFTAQQASATFEPVFGKLAAHLTETGGLASAEFLHLIDLTDQYGIKSKAVTEWVKSGVSTAAEGLLGFLTTAQSAHQGVLDSRTQLADLEKQLAAATTTAEREELAKRKAQLTKSIAEQETLLSAVGMSSQAAATGVSSALWGMYDALLKKGVSVADALAQMAPAVSAMQAELARTGFQGSDAFGALQRMVALTTDSLAGPALQSIQGLGSGMTALHNTGILNAEMFSGMAGQIAHTFDTLVASGKTGSDVLQVMQPQLQTMWQLWKDKGWAIDEATQNMLEQAEAQGIVGDAQRSVEERSLIGIERIASATERLADLFAGKLPSSMETGADTIVDQVIRVSDSLDEAFSRPRTIPVDWDIPDLPSIPGYPGSGSSGGSYHTGGLVSSARRATSGLGVPAWAPRFHAGGEVPAVLQSGEFVVSRRGVQALGMAALTAVNGGSVGAGVRRTVETPIQVNVYSPVQVDGREIARANAKYQTRVLTELGV
jgi:hypothetical protein